MNNDQGSARQAVCVTFFKVLSQHLHGETVENHETSESKYSVSDQNTNLESPKYEKQLAGGRKKKERKTSTLLRRLFTAQNLLLLTHSRTTQGLKLLYLRLRRTLSN
jgi:hypothetical protein